jgi:glucose-6-phosphate-specific signal transduction histidine kinase
MPRQTSRTKLPTQLDWLVGNLRWLLLVSVGIVTLINPTRTPMNDIHTLLTLGLLLAGAAYNVVVMILLVFQVPARPLPLLTVILDAVLSVGLVVASGGASSPLFFFGLFPIITSALRFGWVAGLVTALGIALAYVGAAMLPIRPDANLAQVFPVILNSLILIMAAMLTGILSDRMQQIVSRLSLAEEEADLRRLRAARDQVRAIFEMAGTLGATLSYYRILDAILDVASMGFKELGPAARHMVSVVFAIRRRRAVGAVSRRLTIRDQQRSYPARPAWWPRRSSQPTPSRVASRCGTRTGTVCGFAALSIGVCVPLRAGFAAMVWSWWAAQIRPSSHRARRDADGRMQPGDDCDANAQLYQRHGRKRIASSRLKRTRARSWRVTCIDGPTQSIAAIAMRLNYTRKLLQREPDKVDGEIAKVEELARRTTKEIRHMLFTLRPLVLETQGLTAALEQSIQKVHETDSSVTIHLEAVKVEDKIDMNTQGVVYYIIEEAVGNARKHARANNIWVRLKLEPDALIAEVQDDGEGFDVPSVTATYESRGSLGMVNMRERAELVNGELALDSAPGKGTLITLAVPLHKD